MAKLLFISPTFPYPKDRGWNIRVSNLLKACAQDFSVTLVAPEPDDTVRESGIHSIGAAFVGVWPPVTTAGDEKKSTIQRVIGKFYNSQGKARSRYQTATQSLNLDDFDLIWVERRSQFACVAKAAHKVILDLDDIEHTKLWQELRLTHGVKQKFLLLPRLAAIFFWEIFMSRRALAVVVCSEADRKYLERFGLKNVRVIPNGTAIETAAEDFSEKPRMSKAVFLGNMGYPPNMDAVRHFAEQIMPLVLARHSDFRLDVIGPKPAELQAISERVEFLGFADDLPATLQNYAVMVVPLRFGGGTKLKVLDAMASGVPIVTTNVGAIGLDLVDGRNAFVTDDPEEFAERVCILLEDPELGMKLCTNAHGLVTAKFSWKNIRAETAEWLARLAGQQ